MPVGSIVNFLRRKSRDFLRDRRANVAMMFGLSLVPMLVATGAGVDFARGVMVHQRMAEALDAAALAVGNATSKPAACSSSGNAASQSSCAALKAMAQQYFDQNYDHTQDSSYGTPTAVSIDIANQSVTLSSSLNLKLTLLGITPLGVSSPSVSASSTVVWGQTKLWVALVLDNSGSMSQGDSGGSKMAALQDAITNSTYGLLGILQNAAANAGDVEVGIVPFTRSVNIGLSSSSGYIDWGEWEAPPANAGLTSSIGPGSSCPWSTGTQGYRCTSGSANGSSSVSTVPSSGLLCPGIDNGNANADHNDRYYNGCYDSVATQTKTVTSVDTTPVTDSQNCTQVGSGTISCSSRNGYPSDGNTSNNTTTTYANGYTADSTSNTSNTVTNSTSDGSKSCSTSHGVTTCTWRRTITQTRTDTTITKTAYNFSHTWHPNAHSTWSGCVMDRQQKNKTTTLNVNGAYGTRTAAATDYDTSNSQPTNSTSAWDDTQFPAENAASCPAAGAVTLNYDWTTLASKVNAMTPNGSTNQAIGVELGWQMLTQGAPFGTGALPAGTTKVLILFSDGLNTQDRWYGDGSTEGTTQDGYIDTRENTACTAAKNDSVTIYAIFIHIGTNGSSTALSNCASDSSKFYDLTSSSQIKDAFKDIAQKITNLRVSK